MRVHVLISAIKPFMEQLQCLLRACSNSPFCHPCLLPYERNKAVQRTMVV